VARACPSDAWAARPPRVTEALRSERLAEDLGFRVGAKSDGNPFFVFEILRALRESGRLTKTDDGSWVRTQAIREIEIPSSVRDLVQARLCGLAEEDKDLLDVAACCGDEFDPRSSARRSGSADPPSSAWPPRAHEPPRAERGRALPVRPAPGARGDLRGPVGAPAPRVPRGARRGAGGARGRGRTRPRRRRRGHRDGDLPAPHRGGAGRAGAAVARARHGPRGASWASGGRVGADPARPRRPGAAHGPPPRAGLAPALRPPRDPRPRRGVAPPPHRGPRARRRRRRPRAARRRAQEPRLGRPARGRPEAGLAWRRDLAARARAAPSCGARRHRDGPAHPASARGERGDAPGGARPRAVGCDLVGTAQSHLGNALGRRGATRGGGVPPGVAGTRASSRSPCARPPPGTRPLPPEDGERPAAARRPPA
jgi:hypothetical protein